MYLSHNVFEDFNVTVFRILQTYRILHFNPVRGSCSNSKGMLWLNFDTAFQNSLTKYIYATNFRFQKQLFIDVL